MWFGTRRGDPADPGPDSGAGPVGVARGSLADVTGVPWSFAQRGERREEKERSEKAMVRVTCLSPASSEVFRCREGSVRRGVGSGGFIPGERGAAGAAGRGSENCCSLMFLHYITSNLPQLSVITNSHASDFYTNSKSMHSSLPLAAERLFPSKIFSFTRPGGRARPARAEATGVTELGGRDVFNRFGVGCGDLILQQVMATMVLEQHPR